MASAEVLQNSEAASSRKQGHLEAGRRRLEEFRKKKAEGKARKVASTGQLLSPEVNHKAKLSQDHEPASDRAPSEGDAATIDLSRSITVIENNAVASSQSTEADQSTVAGAVSLNKGGKSHTDHLSAELAQDERSTFYKSSGFSPLIDGYYLQEKAKNDSSSDREPEKGFADEFATGQQDGLYPVYPNTTFEVENRHSLPYSSVDAKSDNQKTSGDQYIKDKGKSEAFQSSSFNLPGRTRTGLKQNMGLFSNAPSDENAFIMYEDTTGVQQRRPDVMKNDGSTRLNFSEKKVYGSFSRHHDIESEPSRSSQSSENSSSTFKSSSIQQPFSSTISGPGTWRTRSSFLDFLTEPRPSSVSHLLPSESARADPSLPLTSSNLYAEVHPLFRKKPEDDDSQRSDTLVNKDSFGSKEASFHFSASLSDGQQMREEVRDGEGMRMQDFPGLAKDEDFAALEQHIEDLTQEKFSLQRALESSQVLVESLAAENSSLTQSFNQQGEVVNQLKSDMEQLQEEIRAQLMALEAVKMEYANAQLECSAADERAKILASEVIGLEEKALRLRSNELKLEKQLEKSNSEINSYRKKVSSLEKERQDFQSTIEALQEEKKLLQSKLRKASSNGKAIDTGTASIVKKDVFTSTEDLGIELSDQVDGQNPPEMMSSAAEVTGHEIKSPALLSGNVSMSNSQAETTYHSIPDACGVIPYDQLRMIDNINSLISELVLEKEELMKALRVQSTNNSKLMDLNKELSQKLETQTQRLELLTAQYMAGENVVARPVHTQSTQDATSYTDEGDEVVERVLSWIMKLFPGGPTKRRTSKLL